MVKDCERKLLIHLHIYYEDQTVAFLERIKHAVGQTPFCLVVTVNEDHLYLDGIQKQVKSFFPDATIMRVSNAGYDVYPFIYMLRNSDLDSYEYVLKLHTKNAGTKDKTFLNGLFITDKEWSSYLINSLIGSEKKLRDAIAVLDNEKNCGMVGASECITEEYYYCKTIDTQIARMGLPKCKEYRYIAGTMFLAKTALIKQLIIYSLDDFVSSDAKTKDGTLAHICERLFGCMVSSWGYDIRTVQGCDNAFNYKLKHVIQELKFFLKRRIAAVTLKLKKNSLLRLLHESDLFDERWYEENYLKPNGINMDPAMHYLFNGGFCGYDPSPFFSSKGYYLCNPDIELNGQNPLIHYLRKGKKENRLFCRT